MLFYTTSFKRKKIIIKNYHKTNYRVFLSIFKACKVGKAEKLFYYLFLKGTKFLVIDFLGMQLNLLLINV